MQNRSHECICELSSIILWTACNPNYVRAPVVLRYRRHPSGKMLTWRRYTFVVESRPWLGATLCSYISWHQPLLIVDFVFAMNNARLASFNLHYIVGSEKKTPDPRQTPSENSGYGDLVYTHEISYSLILLLSLFSLWLNNTLYSINKLV